MILKNSFKCEHCGSCCQILVKVSDKEIESIRKLGYKNFAMKNLLNPRDETDYLKMNGRDCFFLEWKYGKDGEIKSNCKIYRRRPRICRQYPFFGRKKVNMKSCRP